MPAATQPEELCLEKSRGNYLKEDKKTHRIKRGRGSKERQMEDGDEPTPPPRLNTKTPTNTAKNPSQTISNIPAKYTHNSSPPPPLRKT